MGKAEELEEFRKNCTGKGRPPTDPKKRKIYDEIAAANATKKGAPALAKPKKKKTAKKSTPKKVAAATRRAAAAKEDQGTVITPAKLREKVKKKTVKRPGRTPRVTRGLPSAAAQPPTSPLDNTPMVLSENSLHDIIALCRKENVAHLKVGTFEIHLAAGPTTNGQEAGKAETEPRAGVPASSAPQSVQGSDPTALDDLDETQDMIDNPLGFEQAQIDGASRQGAVSAGSEDRRAESDLRGG